jgi:hypothetical protein
MNRLLLGYSPDLDLFDEFTPDVLVQGQRAVAHGIDSTGHAIELLNALARPEQLHASLLTLLRQAGGRRIGAARAAALATLLQRAVGQLMPPARVFGRRAGAMAQAARFFDVELEGLSPEDREFEVARRFTLLAADAAQRAAQAPPHLPPPAVAQQAAALAARRYAPGWLHRPTPRASRAEP